MTDAVLEIDHLTKDYGNGRGIFDIDIHVHEGEAFGYVGTNGSGKTTTIRNLMGFIKPDSGSASVRGLDSWERSAQIMQDVAYIPGEIAFPGLATGTDFLKLQAEYLGVHDFGYMNHLIEVLQLDPTANLKRMSKGMKQKTAIVAALMGDKDILVMDEPTTGLDPLMRDSFIDLIRDEKKKGRTVFMSSHIFDEIEAVCDKVAMIEDGRIVDVADLRELRHGDTKRYLITFRSASDSQRFATLAKSARSAWPADETGQTGGAGLVTSVDGASCEVALPASDIGGFLDALRGYDISDIRELKISLENHFLNIYETRGR